MIGIGLILVWLLFAIYGLLKKDYVSIYVLILFCVFQNIVLIGASPYINKLIFNLLVLIKEVYVILLILKKIIINRKITKFQLGCIISVVFIVIFGFVHGSESMTGMLLSVRQLSLPFLFFLLGSLLFESIESINKVIYFFIVTMLVTAIFGWIEMSLGVSFWTSLGYRSFAELKGTVSGLSYEGVHGAFFTWDLGVRLRRMASFLAEPVILGQLLAFSFIYCFFSKDLIKSRVKRLLVSLTLGIALLFTIAKGGLIIAFLAFCFLIGDLWHQKRLSFVAKVVFFVTLIIGIVYIVKSEHNGSVSHLIGLTENLKNLLYYPFGRGIGVVGNLGYNYGGRGELLASGESFVGAAIGQMGFFAILLYSYFYLKMLKKLSIASRGKTFSLARICLWLNVGLLVNALANNTAVSFTSCFIYYIIAGGIYHIDCVDQEYKEGELIHEKNRINYFS